MRDVHIQHRNKMLTSQQTALQAQSSESSVPHLDLHREMLARVKETLTSDLVGGLSCSRS